MNFLEAYLPILIFMDIFSILITMIFIVLSCSLLKKWTLNLLAISTALTYVSRSFVSILHVILWNSKYGALSFGSGNQHYISTLSHLPNFIGLGYALERYRIICSSLLTSIKTNVLLTLLYVTIAVFLQISIEGIITSMNPDFNWTVSDSEMRICLSLFIFFVIKYTVMILGSGLHTILVVGMNRRLDVSILMQKSMKHECKVKKFERIKRLNASTLILQFFQTIFELVHELRYISESLMCVFEMDQINFPIVIKMAEICHLITSMTMPIGSNLFCLFHYMYVPRFSRIFRKLCTFKFW